MEIDRKFRNLALGLTDASVVALGERIGVHRVLTSNSDLTVVRFGPGCEVISIDRVRGRAEAGDMGPD